MMQSNSEASLTGVVFTSSEATKQKRLVVLVPGFMGRCSLWGLLRERLEQEIKFRPHEAQWLLFDHKIKWWSIGSIDDLAIQLHSQIVAEWIRSGGFNDVVLVGHSMGGLIVRQAYLLAAGAVAGENASEWGQYVSRIVLLASLNRGVELRRVPWIWPLAWINRIFPFLPHLLLEDTQRGSNFLTNLRINWIRHFGALTEAHRRGELWTDNCPKRPPLVVQILGSRDGIVRREDSKDVLAFPRSHYLQVPDADHRRLYRLEFAADPELRYAVLRQGFIGEFPDEPVGALETEHNDASIKRVVFLLHGIRASNVDDWIKGIERRISTRDLYTIVKQPTYGYFSAARFVLPSVRRKNIVVFQDWYTEALAEYPTAEFDIMAHSNGTYILGQSLLTTPGMRFNNVALVGSVLPTSFPWKELMERGQVNQVRNDRANRDWPVALLCNALRGLRMEDVGTGGFAGFEGNATHEVAYYFGGHGEALKPDYQDILVDFVFNGTVQEPATLSSSPGYFRQFSNAMPYVARLVVLTVGVGVGWLIFQGCLVQVFWSVLAIIITYVILDII
ncbi:alpha/beta fold hydrolase [Nostoc sp. TCL26-01]|uniref:alpha/beta fold hydrolase n=1 Tax=Nostoc sp. TCL26-01 TaxID=2576904 RepID=UPI0015B95406|nr:alpha/beta hydrolase [Nostoc sp. TCL26-01]QLE59889.1 alpha/beta hydrolase [Nostoc sp. TCL26-01]